MLFVNIILYKAAADVFDFRCRSSAVPIVISSHMIKKMSNATRP